MGKYLKPRAGNGEVGAYLCIDMYWLSNTPEMSELMPQQPSTDKNIHIFLLSGTRFDHRKIAENLQLCFFFCGCDLNPIVPNVFLFFYCLWEVRLKAAAFVLWIRHVCN